MRILLLAAIAVAGLVLTRPAAALPLVPVAPHADIVLVRGGPGHVHGNRGRHLGWIIGRHRGWSHSHHRMH